MARIQEAESVTLDEMERGVREGMQSLGRDALQRGQRYCKSPSDELFSYPWTSGMGLKGVRPVAFGAPKG
jgi:hypothetical protein